MKLKELLCGIAYNLNGTDPETEISVPVTDSRRAKKDSLFICIDGTKRRGTDYLKNAKDNGAVACVISEASAKRSELSISCITVPDTRVASAVIWNNYYNRPAEKMRLYGITGTCGKTTTAGILMGILNSAGRKTGLIGTSGVFSGGRKLEIQGSETGDIAAAMTTPDPEYLYGALAEMRENGVTDAVIEVSSHAIYQKKTEPLSFFCGVFTNLSAEHLDLHGDMESYFAVKKSFLDKCQILIYNRDDRYGKRFYPIGYSYGLTNAENVIEHDGYMEFDFVAEEEKIRILSHNIGEFNIYNILAAITCARAAGVSPADISNGIFNAPPLSGRMERVTPKDCPVTVYIDYAHTPAAMEAVLSQLKKTNAENLTVLFGCGGDRDREKRHLMGETASRYAKRIIVTSDNPRWEDPENIIKEILTGIPEGTDVTVIKDRREAILYAVKTSVKGETIALLGKGHENYEIVEDRKIPFSEKEILHQALGFVNG